MATLQLTTRPAVLISMNAPCTMATALRSASTRSVVTCVSADRDMRPLIMSKYFEILEQENETTTTQLL